MKQSDDVDGEGRVTQKFKELLKSVWSQTKER